MLRGPALDVAISASTAALATVLAKAAIATDRHDLAAPLLALALPAWAWTVRLALAWADGTLHERDKP